MAVVVGRGWVECHESVTTHFKRVEFERCSSVGRALYRYCIIGDGDRLLICDGKFYARFGRLRERSGTTGLLYTSHFGHSINIDTDGRSYEIASIRIVVIGQQGVVAIGQSSYMHLDAYPSGGEFGSVALFVKSLDHHTITDELGMLASVFPSYGIEGLSLDIAFYFYGKCNATECLGSW